MCEKSSQAWHNIGQKDSRILEEGRIWVRHIRMLIRILAVCWTGDDGDDIFMRMRQSHIIILDRMKANIGLEVNTS
jgi:hypothetical protein